MPNPSVTHLRSATSVALGLAISLLYTVSFAAETFPHDDWAVVLEQYVDHQGFVDYNGLARSREALDSYVSAVNEISPKTAPERFPTRNDELAYYLNAYNALVFEGVIARGPEKKSVWRGLVSGYSFFVKMKVVVGGERMSLKALEDKEIRARYQDARVHAALNCASVGCPRLPRQPFVGDRLDKQLDAVMREFVSSEKHVAVDPDQRTLSLSKIFDWFKDDFLEHERQLAGGGDPSLVDAINRYRSDDDQLPSEYKIDFPPYDKRINSQK